MEKINYLIENFSNMDLANAFLLTDDIERMRKLLVKNYLFNKIIELPGDIVELGVFKGSGFINFIKFLEIYIPGSNKKVIGFDLFNKVNFTSKETEQLENYYSFCDISKNGISKNIVESFANKLPLANYNANEKTLFKKKKFELIEGDVCKTIPEYLKRKSRIKNFIIIL